MRLVGVCIVVLCVASAGCITAPKVEVPQPVASGSLGLSSQVQGGPTVRDWWSSFNDAQLDHLMQQALAQNPSLAEALARVREAQSMADLARAGQLPSVDFNGHETRERLSGHDPIPKPYPGTTQWLGRAGVDLSWELDFWGRQQSFVKQARSQTAAAALDVVSARLALSGTVAQTYIDLYRNDALADVAQRTQAQRERILEIARHRLQSGLDTNVEVREAAGAVPEAQVALLQSQAAAALDIHQLAALSGEGATVYAQILRPTLDPGVILPVPAALPADLLGRRPDILAARNRIDAARSGQAAAKAAFYPDINLVAFAGVSSIGMMSALLQGASTTYGAGPAVHLPLFDAGRLRAEYRGSAAEVDAAVAAYNGSVLQAVRETSDELSLVAAINEQLIEQQRSLDDAEEAYRLAEERYRAGLSNYLTVLNAETAVLSARREHIALVSDEAIARVNLLLAVGGNFDPQTETP